MELLRNRIRAGYPGLAIITHEEDRAASLVQSVCQSIDFNLFQWTCTSGLRNIGNNTRESQALDPTDVLPDIRVIEEKSVVFMRDMHLFLSEVNPTLYRALKETLTIAKTRQICLVFCMPALKLPLDLERCFSVIDFDLPGPEELTRVLSNLCMVDGIEAHPMPTGDDLAALLDAAAGLTCAEAEDAFALSLVTTSTFDVKTIMREKANTIRNNGLCEVIESPFTLDDVGGWDAFKKDLLRSRHQFTPAAAEYHLEPRKGLLLLGMPGCGKSLAAPILGGVFGIPVLKVDASNLGGTLYSQTEQNWRSVMKSAKALKKCIVYVDEVDGMTAGAASSGKTDGGTTGRLVKAFLQDIQDSTGIFFVFTANDIDNLPDPLIDRLDVWSVELPNNEERKDIWAIHIARRQRNPKGFDLPKLAQHSEGFSGRQIERAWLAAMTLAFDDNAREPTTSDVVEVLTGMVPTSKTMKEAIETRRQRLAGRAKPVTSPTVQSLTASRKIS